MEEYHLEKPDLSKIDQNNVAKTFLENFNDVYPFLERVNEQEYLYWTDVKRKPRPEGMSAEVFWSIVKFNRKFQLKYFPIKTKNGELFSWFRQQKFDRILRRIDMELGGRMMTDQLSTEKQQKFVARGLLEEAIASSQLEGADTARRVAKTMIAEGRTPQNTSEYMIYNNYRTMKYIEENLVKKELSEELLLDLHAQLTDKTIDQKDVGRWRKDKDEIVIKDRMTGVVYHIPPNEKFMRSNLGVLINYFNDMEENVHPVIKAITIHFWLAYLHPFVDGNGRMARMLFYWYLLKKDYWMMSFVPISTMIKRAPRQYSDAYIFSEQDDSDLTYFIAYNIDHLVMAMDELQAHMRKLDAENNQIDRLLGPEYALNDRQKQLLHYLVGGGSSAVASIKSHGTLNGISRLTATKDLQDLEKKNLVSVVRVGKKFNFYASKKLVKLVG
jgi:Fic family protein